VSYSSYYIWSHHILIQEEYNRWFPLNHAAFCLLHIFTLYFTYGAEAFLRSCQLCSHSGSSQFFKEPEGSLPCSQEPSIGPYPDPNRSSSHHPILSL
jgi:hypothetical protein